MKTLTMEKPATKMTTEPTAPGFRLEDFPAYITERDKLHGLIEQKDALDLTIRRTQETLQGSGIERQAAAVLAGSNVGDLASEQGLRLDVEAARHESAVLAKAIESQRDIVERAKNRAAFSIREKRRPEHVAIGKRIEAAMLKLREAIAEEEAFRAELYQGGVAFAEPLIPLGFSWPILAEWFNNKSDYGITGVSSNA